MIKILKSTLKVRGNYISNALGLQQNEIMLGEDLMDSLNIIDGEIVEVLLEQPFGQFNAYVSTGEPKGSEILVGRIIGAYRVLIISSYSYMNQESALNNKPIRLKKI